MMATSAAAPLVLLVGLDPDLRELNELILADAGYRTADVPVGADPVDVAARSRPDVIVAGVPPLPTDRTVVDLLRTNPTTREIPVCVIATGEHAAAASSAAPNVRDSIVAPYDPTALEDGVARALGNPLPSAVLPAPAQPLPATVALAGNALIAQARQIVLRAVLRLHESEPYHSRFPDLSRALVDHLGTVFGVAANGLLRGIPPADVTEVPAIARTVDEQVRARRAQGIDLAAILCEYQALEAEIDYFLESLVGVEGFTDADAFAVSRQVAPYLNALERLAAARYVQSLGQ
jgi:CheY-like chemotaxis protein